MHSSNGMQGFIICFGGENYQLWMALSYSIIDITVKPSCPSGWQVT
jgi:hypothetical protein